MIEVPVLARPLMISMSSSVSCGVNTAVGSSSTKTLAFLASDLIISTRCCAPTGRSWIFASGSISNPKRSEISLTSSRALSRSRPPIFEVGSLPRTTFSATVKTGISMKCWWTIPMPAAIASPGPLNLTGWSSIRI